MRLDAANVREVRELIDLTTTYHSPARSRMLARKAHTGCTLKQLFPKPAKCCRKPDFILLGKRYLRLCACVIIDASSGWFPRFLFYGFGSLHRDLNAVSCRYRVGPLRRK